MRPRQPKPTTAIAEQLCVLPKRSPEVPIRLKEACRVRAARRGGAARGGGERKSGESGESGESEFVVEATLERRTLDATEGEGGE